MFIDSSTLSSCLVSDDDQHDALEPFIGLPDKPFQLRRGSVTPMIYLHYRKAGGWCAVHASVVDSIRLANLWRARLYEGVCADGQPFLFPATQATNPEYLSWETSTLEVIKQAQAGRWVTQASDKSRAERIAHIDTRLRHAPQWFDGSLEELLEKAFKGRIIDHPQHPLITGLRRAPCYEEIEESYP